MNIYGTTFVARCPANGKAITYMLRIHTGATIMVEDIRAEVESITEGYHEAIADQLCAKFGGSQRLVAKHHGVEIETIRPHIAHWAAADPIPSQEVQPSSPQGIPAPQATQQEKTR